MLKILQIYKIHMQIFAVVMGVSLLNALFWRNSSKGTIAKFRKKKIETLGYFPLADCMALSSAVIEL